MKNMDYNMPFMLQYENVAWYEKGQVKILDRRVYPRQVRFEICKEYTDVVQAIKNMVTQSAGPYTAAAMGMALASHQIQKESWEVQKKWMCQAAHDLSHARITTVNRMSKITQNAYQVWERAVKMGQRGDEAIFQDTIDSLNRRYSMMDKVGKYLSNTIKDKETLLTQCFGETIIGTLFRNLKEQNKAVKVYCSETRPYFQGARLTATCTYEMGFDTTVVSDNMIAYLMETETIDLFTSAADTITRSGYIANKVGTNQIALIASHFHVPYFVTGIPDEDKYTKEDINIEMRDPNEVLSANGIRHTKPGIKSIYPSFDITCPKYIDGVVTDKGIFSPFDLERYFLGKTDRFY